jgi:hypothetical protein
VVVEVASDIAEAIELVEIIVEVELVAELVVDLGEIKLL